MKFLAAAPLLASVVAGFRLRSGSQAGANQSAQAAQEGTLPDPFCKKGVVSSDLLACCPSECGTCDTHELCSKAGLFHEVTGKFADHCCSELVRAKAQSCEKDRPPCVLSERYRGQLSAKKPPAMPSRHAAKDCHQAVNKTRISMSIGVARGQLSASLQNAERLLREAQGLMGKVDEWVEESNKEAEAKIADAKAALPTASTAKDGTGGSEASKLQDEIHSQEQAIKFHGQMDTNADKVKEAAAALLSEAESLGEEVLTSTDMDTMRQKVKELVVDAEQVYKDAEAALKQMEDSGKAFDCGVPPAVENGEECEGGDTKFSQKCRVKCEPGYDEDTSRNSLICARQGKFGQVLYGEWFGMATCAPQNCGMPPTIESASQAKQEIVYPHAAVYQCAEGFSHDGDAKGNKSFAIPCITSGHFDRDPSQECLPVRCGGAPQVANAQPVSGQFVYHDVAHYECLEGFSIDGTAGGLANFSAVCQATGEFTQRQKCRPVRCGPFPDMEHARVVSGAKPAEKVYNDEVGYECLTGYTLTGIVGGDATYTLKCTKDGEFVATTTGVPACLPVSNGMAPGVTHGLFEPREMVFGESARIMAEVGYSTEAKPDAGRSFVLRTTAQGVYEGSKEFLRVDCGAPPTVARSSVSWVQPTAKFGDVVPYQCEDGYSTDYTPEAASLAFSLVCEGDGTFSQVPGEGECVNINDCLGHTCGAHGNCVDLLKDYECECQAGFEQEVDAYSGEKICGNIDDCGPSGCGVGTCEDLIQDYRCICPEGYEETYDGEEKTCTRKLCGTPPELPNAQTSPLEVADEKMGYLDEVLYQCLEGHTLNASYPGKNHYFIKCQADKTFTGPPMCKPVRCGEVPTISHATPDKNRAVFNQTVTYTCATGHTTDGTADGDGSFGINCTADGSYTEPGACAPVSCGEPDEAANAWRPDGELVYEDKVTYTCFDGFSLDGDAAGAKTKELECGADGRVAGVENCNPVLCGDPPDLINVLYASVPDIRDVRYPQTVEILCNDGYTVSGTPTGERSFLVKCQANGTFERHDRNECEPVDCGPLPELEHANPTEAPDGGRLNFAQEATYTCSVGYKLGGEHDAPTDFTVNCLPSGAFAVPSDDMMCQNVNDCEQFTCGPRGRCVDEIGPAPAYHCECESGFEQQIIDGEKFCGNRDDCGGRSCGPGVCRDLINDYTCACPSGHYIGMDGGEKTCLPVECASSAPTVSNGRMVSSHSGPFLFPRTLTYRCDNGYSIDGSAVDSKKSFQVSCLASGSPSEMFACRPISCGAPQVLPHTQLLEPSNSRATVTFGQTAKYRCNHGYTVGGTGGGATEFTVTCRATGSTTSPQSCLPVACGRAPAVTKARPGIAGVITYGMHLTYECDAGYTTTGTLSGSTTFPRQCKLNGEFSAVTAQCKPLSARAPSVPGATRVSGGATVYVGQSVTYACISGNSVNGASNGATRFHAVVNTQGRFTPALPSRCTPIVFNVGGQIRDARTGGGLGGVHVRMGSRSTHTSSSGHYMLTGIPMGNVQQTISKQGFITYQKTVQISSNLNGGGISDALLAPVMRSDEWRATFGWGSEPRDLDTHVNWGSNRVYYASRYVSAWGGMAARLERDVVSGYGPETVHFTGIGHCPSSGGAYHCHMKYIIHKYSSSGPWEGNPNIKVTLYAGSSVKGTWKLSECPRSVDGRYWHVFTLDGTNNRLHWHCKQSESLVQVGHGLDGASSNASGVDFESYVGPFPGRYFRKSRQHKRSGNQSDFESYVGPFPGRFFRGSSRSGSLAAANGTQGPVQVSKA